MRYVIYGLGAIGGTLAAALMRSGQEVVAIARGKMLDAVRDNGLLFRTPAGDERFNLTVVAAPDDITFRPDDAILLTMKSQDTAAALDALLAAGVTEQPVLCCQNGVNNERLALRLFPNVYGVTVMLPGDYVTPGEVVCYGTPRHGILDIGRYPQGMDDVGGRVATDLQRANFAVFSQADIMRSKYGKLLENLGNVVDAAVGPSGRTPEVMQPIRAEAEAAYHAAGITDWIAISEHDPRRQGVMAMGEVPGAERAGSSSSQSLKRGTGSIETDYLNGEIVLMGRLHGVPVPLNAALCVLGRELADGTIAPGSLTLEKFHARLGL